MSNRASEAGFERIFRLDHRRGVWMRSTPPEQIEVVAGREGDDHAVTFKAGDTVTTEQLQALETILNYARLARAAFYPDRSDL